MSQIKFLGASGTVTGSSYLLHNDHTNILIDLGMFQGLPEISELNYQPLLFDASKLDAVVLTHAHIDHCGRLPMLAKAGFKGKIYMTEPTRTLTELTLHDSAKIAKEDDVHEPLYQPEDVDSILRQVEVIPYDHINQIGSYDFQLLDAGHILGSASILFKDTLAEKGLQTIVFSGDLGNDTEELLRPTELIGKADIVTIESTYGDRDHPVEDPWAIIQAEINAVEQNDGTLLIPSFSIEKTQEILHIIDHLKSGHRIKAETKVFLDSPMAIKATEIYRQFPYLYGEELSKHCKHDDPFDFPGLSMTVASEQSKMIKTTVGPKVIIAGSGMMSGGRILFHAKYYLPNPTTRLLFVGYQAEGTIGREIQEGAELVKLFDQDVAIRSHLQRTQSLSSHAGQSQLLKWLGTMKGINKVFITHGEDEPRDVLAYKIRNELEITDVTLPHLGDEVTIN